MPLKDPVKRKEYYDAFRKTEHAKKYQHEWYMNSGRREKYAAATEEEKKARSKKRSIANIFRNYPLSVMPSRTYGRR